MSSDRFVPLKRLDVVTDGPSRRQMLKLMAASAALAGAACSRTPDHAIHPHVHQPEAGTSGLPVYYASALVSDGLAHGVLIGTSEGRPIKIEGNRRHPSSRGATDIHAQASVLTLWDPDRSTTIRQRVGPGRPPSTWSAFESAWRACLDALPPGSASVRVLTGAFSSPTLHAQMQQWLAREPRLRWHRHLPLGPSPSWVATQGLHGRALDALLHLDRARFVLSLGADPFSPEQGGVRHAGDWARARSAAEAQGMAPARAMAIEMTPGLFGARADERHAMHPSDIENSLQRIGGALVPGLAADDQALRPWERRAVQALRAARGDALIVCGPALSPAAQALALLLNQQLGHVGRTIEFIEPNIAAPDGREPASLQALVQDMRQGRVAALVILGGNPVFDAPHASDWRAAMSRVPFTAHLSEFDDETSERCTWHLPRSHDIEQWSDARSQDGTITVIQPAIAPLYDSRSAHELVDLLAGHPEGLRAGHDLIRQHWRGQRSELEDAAFQAFWTGVLQAGLVDGSGRTPIDLPRPDLSKLAALQPPRDVHGRRLVAVFRPDEAAADGRHANNAWLQELPRPFTRHSWGNVALLAPATAAGLGVSTGDVVRLVHGERQVEAPAWVLHGQAEDVVGLTVGLGRRRAGRVGDGVGYDGYALMGDDAGPLAVMATRTGRRVDFAVAQHEIESHGRDLARTVAPGGRIEDAPPRPHSGTQPSGPPTPDRMPSLYPPKAPQAHAWAMVIDLDLCIGCNACTIACQAENNIPVVGADQVARGRDMHWIRVDNVLASSSPDTTDDRPETLFQPVPCMHCENAPCEVVCPVGATVHDSDGLNVQVYNRCIGTRFCSNNCPYKVRRFNFLPYGDETEETLKLQRNPDVTVRQRGVMEKCTYCVQRISHARLASEKSGRPIEDGDVVTACQAVCPTQAIHFGDRNDSASDVVRAARSDRHYSLLEELNTRPRTTYLARQRPLPSPEDGKT